MNIAVTDHPTSATVDVTDSLGALVAALGLDGVAVLLILAAVLLKAPKLRRWLSRRIRRAIRAALRAAWWALTDYALIWVRYGIRPTSEERRLLRRLAPRHWREHADARGLGGTLTGRARLTHSGVVAAVRLSGTWTPRKLRDAEPLVRNLLGCRTDLRMEIKAGSKGGWAEMTLRTRTAADGIDLSGWTPGAPWGVDTVTGELVTVPLGRRMLIAGTSGAGKSWSTRAILAEASEAPDHALVVIDPKRVEAINWEHRARTAVSRDDVLAVTDELVAEMYERLELVPRGQDVIQISPERPRITVFVDEGAEVIGMARDREYRRVLDNLSTLARMARAAEIILVWATQKPTMDARGGIDPQISAQITYRAALALSTSAEARTVLGEDATERGWHAHDLPMPGYALLRHGPKARPHPIKTRAFSPADVIALPDRPVWQRAASPAAVDSAPTLTLVKGETAVVPAQPSPPSTAELVLSTLAEGESTAAALVKATGRSSSQVYAALASLRESGAVTKTGKRYALPAAGDSAAEVTA